MKTYKDIFKNKKIIVTGHTGFKGSWLTAWLVLLGAKVTGISNNIPTKPSHFETLKIKLESKGYFSREHKTPINPIYALIALFLGSMMPSHNNNNPTCW